MEEDVTARVTTGLTRREFLRRATMATIAAAGGASIYGFSTKTNPTAAASQAIPTLDVPDPVRSIAALPGRLVAVGGRSSEGATMASVWTHTFGDNAWLQTATGSAFPRGTVLEAVAGMGETILAAGRVFKLNRTLVVIDDETREPIQLPVFQSSPAIFSSVDGAAWKHVLDHVPGSTLGALTGIAASRDGTQALAVGSKFACEIMESSGLLAVRSSDGSTWETEPLGGVEPPQHGSITLLAQIGSEFLIATRAIGRTSKLYLTSGPRWREIRAPAEDAAFFAAGAIDGTLLLAGVGISGEPRFWMGGPEAWRAVDQVPGAPPGAHVMDIEEAEGFMVAAEVHKGTGHVAVIGG